MALERLLRGSSETILGYETILWFRSNLFGPCCLLLELCSLRYFYFKALFLVWDSWFVLKRSVNDFYWTLYSSSQNQRKLYEKERDVSNKHRRIYFLSKNKKNRRSQEALKRLSDSFLGQVNFNPKIYKIKESLIICNAYRRLIILFVFLFCLILQELRSLQKKYYLKELKFTNLNRKHGGDHLLTS